MDDRPHQIDVPKPIIRQLADAIVSYAPLDDIRVMLASGVDINEPVAKGLRLLHYAAFHRHVDAVNLLLLRGADPSVMDDVGYTPLHLCAERGYCNAIRIFVQYKARVDFSKVLPGDGSYGTPPRASQAEEPLNLALKNGFFQAAKLLLKNGANPNTRYFLGHEINLLNPLDIESIELLLQCGADPNARDRQGMTPLMKACRNPEALDTAHLLISYGAEVDAMTDEDRRTPLHYAVLGGNLNVVQLLVDHGATLKLPPDYEKPPPLFFAVLRGDMHVLRFLVDAGADVNVGSAVVGSALHVALTERVENKAEIVQFLLEQGANPNAVTMTSRGPLLKPPLGEYFYSCPHPDEKLVRLLLRYGARVLILGQRQDPIGILKSIHHIDCRECPGVLQLMTEAAEVFCTSLIEGSVLMSNRHKLVLLQKALAPLPLKHVARCRLRRILGWGPALVNAVHELPLPKMLQRYLLFDD